MGNTYLINTQRSAAVEDWIDFIRGRTNPRWETKVMRLNRKNPKRETKKSGNQKTRNTRVSSGRISTESPREENNPDERASSAGRAPPNSGGEWGRNAETIWRRRNKGRNPCGAKIVGPWQMKNGRLVSPWEKNPCATSLIAPTRVTHNISGRAYSPGLRIFPGPCKLVVFYSKKM